MSDASRPYVTGLTGCLPLMPSTKLHLPLTALSLTVALVLGPVEPLLAASETSRTHETIAPASNGILPSTILPGAAMLLAEGTALADLGDYPEAGKRFSLVLRLYPNALEAPDARFGLGMIAQLDKDYSGAEQHFRALRSQYPNHPKAPFAGFWIAEGYRLDRTADKTAEALALYDQFLQAQPQIEDWVRLHQAMLLMSVKDYPGALKEAEAAATSASPTVAQRARRMRADALLEFGEVARALSAYRELLAGSEGSWTKAELTYLVAEAQKRSGDQSGALATQLELVRTYPSTLYAQLSLDAVLKQPGLGLTPYQEGRVYYYQRQNDAALAAFQRQRNSAPASAETPWARYLTGIIYERLGRLNDAAAEYRALVTAAPASPAAQEALHELGWVLEYQNRFDEAATVYREYVNRYPQGADAEDAAFRAGLSWYRLGNTVGAANLWTEAQANATTTQGKARAGFWLSKLQAPSGTATAPTQPGDYYGRRASELATQTRGPAGAAYRPLGRTITSVQEEAAAQAWLDGWAAPLPSAAVSGTADSGVEPLALHPNLRRGELLAAMGLYDAARDEYQQTMAAYERDPRSLYALAQLLPARGQYYVSVAAASRLLQLAPPTARAIAPVALLKLLYPVPYPDLVTRNAQEQGVDPALLLGLIRQESRFDPWATSPATARGLSQVMPATGQDIASKLGVTDFSTDDLYRPVVALRFGAYYLRQQLDSLGGQPAFALAAYNGGAGNALRWMNSDRRTDPDLFLENIDFAETALYLRTVQENYSYYRRLYQSP